MASARTAETRHLASPTIRALIQQRSAELIGLMLGLLGLAVLVALACYDPRDPSLNTATSHHTANLAGPVGPYLVDLLLQGFGVAVALPGVAMLTWAWRIASRRGLGSAAARLAALLAALPVVAGVLASLPISSRLGWPTRHWRRSRTTSCLGACRRRGVLGPVGALMIWVMGLALAGTLTVLALGLSASEWQTAGRGVQQVARFTTRRRWSVPSVRLSLLPRWLRSRRHPDGQERREPEVLTRLVPLKEEEAPPVVTRLTHPVPQPLRRPRQESLPLPEGGWHFPPLSLLKSPPALAAAGPTEEALQSNARLLETVLSDYGVQGAIVEIRLVRW